MAFVVECVRGGPDGEHFCLSSSTWPRLMKLAEAHGWRPEGTTYEPWPVKHHELEGHASDYRPDEWLYAKRISAPDALELARCLRLGAVACGEQRGQTLIVESAGKVYDERLASTALKLAAYCEGGGFLFAVDD